MNRGKVGRQMRQELAGMLRLSPLVLVALVLVILLWSADSAAISGLFQSSPVELPSATPTATEAAAVTASPEPSVTLPASPEVTATTTITETAIPLETPTEVLPTETALPTATSVPTEPPATDTPVAAETSETIEEGPSDESLRYAEEESKLKFEWGMLFDALALFFSYIWLICGVLLFLAVPVFLYFLWRAGERKQEEAQEGDKESQLGEDESPQAGEESQQGED